MTIGTIFTLFIVPSLYVLIARTHHEGREDSDEGDDLQADDDDAPEPAREFGEPALAKERTDDDAGDGHGTWQPA
jgi:hypothetical protein